MHLARHEGPFRVLQDENGALDGPTTLRFHSIGPRGRAGEWWMRKAFLQARGNGVEFSMLDYIAMLESGQVDLVRGGARSLAAGVEAFRGKGT